MFVAFEGIEGSGKSTLLSLLAPALRERGHVVVPTREPGGTPLGTSLRELFLDRCARIDPVAEAFLMNAARAQHVSDVIGPALRRGCAVLCDRFVDSTLAYQGFGRGFDRALLDLLAQTATGGLQPGLTVLLDLPVSESRRRLLARGGNADRIEGEGEAFHERVRAGYLALAADRGDRYLVLDALRASGELLALTLARLEMLA